MTAMPVEEFETPAWHEQALCAQTDPEAFFPEKGGSVRDAKRVCVTCEVKAECLQYALDMDERFGIWGGLSERERRRLKRTGTALSVVGDDLDDDDDEDEETPVDIMVLDEVDPAPLAIFVPPQRKLQQPIPLDWDSLSLIPELCGPPDPPKPTDDPFPGPPWPCCAGTGSCEHTMNPPWLAPPPPAKPRLTKAQRQRVRELLEQGYSRPQSIRRALRGG